MAKKIKEQKSAQQLFCDYCNTWLNVYKKGLVHNRTYDIKESVLTLHIYPELGYLQLGSITSYDLQTLVDEKADILSLNYLRQIFSTLKEIFYYAVSSEAIPENPMKSVVFPHYKYAVVPESNATALTEEEQIRLYKAAFRRKKNGKIIYRVGPASILLLSTGMRIGELLSLKCSDIDLEQKEISIKTTLSRAVSRDEDSTKACIYEIHGTKTKAGMRVIPMNLWAIKAVSILKEELFVENKLNLLFANRKGNIYSRANFAKSFDLVLKSADIEHKSLHSIRHSFATQMIHENLDVTCLSKILGHSNSNITYKIYVHLLNHDKESAIQSLEI